MTDNDTLRCQGYEWYDPNPYGWAPSQWDEYYSVSTGEFRSSSVPPNPDWKWGYPWILPYAVQFGSNQTWLVGGKAFTVTGPHSGFTAFGKAIQFWKLMNRDKFLFWDGGADWTQYVHPGDITLHYEAGRSRLILHTDIRRTYYYQGSQTVDTVQYIVNLTSTNAFSTGQVTTRMIDAGDSLTEANIGDESIADSETRLPGFQPAPVRSNVFEFEITE
jgi:hypothetical protein